MSLAQKHCNKLFSFPCIRCSSSQNKAYKKQIIPLNYTLPGTTLTGEEMERFRDKDLRRLIHQKKLNLIVDLDNTLIHTTTLGTLSSSDKEYMRKQLGKHLTDNSYILKKRPGVSDFLQQLTSLFDITIYTLGGRVYANMVSNILDPDECIFKNVICYEDCTLKGQKRLDVVLSHERVKTLENGHQVMLCGTELIRERN